MEQEIVYNLTAEEYSKYATRAGMALKSAGKKKATMVGFLEVITAVIGLFFYNGNLIYLLVLMALGSTGLYSLLFYPVIFPKTITKNTLTSYRRANPNGAPLTITFDREGITLLIGGVTKSESYRKITLLYCDEGIVFTSLNWSAVLPKEAVAEFDELLEDLKAEDFIEQRAI